MTQAAKRPSASSVRIVLQTKKTISCSDSPAGPLEPTTSIITEPPITPDCSRRSATARPSPCSPWSSCTNRKPCWSLATIRPIRIPWWRGRFAAASGILEQSFSSFIRTKASCSARRSNIDHHRTADYAGLLTALGDRAAFSLLTMEQLYQSKAVLVIGNDPTNQNPLVAWQIRSGIRHFGTKLFVIHSNESKLQRKAN